MYRTHNGIRQEFMISNTLLSIHNNTQLEKYHIEIIFLLLNLYTQIEKCIQPLGHARSGLIQVSNDPS